MSSYLPRLGHTRCYWALLDPSLHFIYTDPVLSAHLEHQANNILGKSLLAFVHPDEQASAQTDLRSVLDSRTLHGSVTRVRFSRLSRVRRQLGYTGILSPWHDADKVAVDDSYMAVDIVINWAADGLVLCFIHATVDLDPQSDNDEQTKSSWSNWCGTPLMPPDQIHLLFRRLLICIPQPLSQSHHRIFQILANQPTRPLLLSWPPDQGSGPTGRDFAKLVENAALGSGLHKGNDAKTSCTRRYRATQLMSPSIGEVESIFIPHGSVIFACHKVQPSPPNPSSTFTNMPSYNSNYSYYDHPPSYPPLNPPYSNPYLNQQQQQQQPTTLPPSYSPRWSHTSQPYSQPSWNPNAQTPSPTIPSQQRAYNPAPIPAPWTSTSTSYDSYRPTSPPPPLLPPPPPPPSSSNVYPNSYSPRQNQQNQNVVPLLSPDIVPPPKRRISPTSNRGQAHTQYLNNSASGSGPVAGPSNSGTGTGTGRITSGRMNNNRPLGILKCSSCGVTTSPEWRKGPSGKKELCNACGLRYARSRVKKDVLPCSGSGTGGRKRKSTGEHQYRGSGTSTGSGCDEETQGQRTTTTTSQGKRRKTTRNRNLSNPIPGPSGSGSGPSTGFGYGPGPSSLNGSGSGLGSGINGSGLTLTPPTHLQLPLPLPPPLSSGSPGYTNSLLRRSFGSQGGGDASPGGASGSGGSENGYGYAMMTTGSGGGSGVSRGGGRRGNRSVRGSGSGLGNVQSGGGSGGNGGVRVGGLMNSPSPTLSLPLPVPLSGGDSTGNHNREIGFIHYNPHQQQHIQERQITIPPLNIRPPPPPPPHPPPIPSSTTPTGTATTPTPTPTSTTANIVTTTLNANANANALSSQQQQQPPSPSYPSYPNSNPNSVSYGYGYGSNSNLNSGLNLNLNNSRIQDPSNGPSPLSQVGNIVTSPEASYGDGAGNGNDGGVNPITVNPQTQTQGQGPLTPSSVPPNSANSENGRGLNDVIGITQGQGQGMQLPPLSYMDRLMQQNHNHNHNHNQQDREVSEYEREREGQGNGGGNGGGGGFGREPLTPLSAESPGGRGNGNGNGRKGGRK